MCFIATANVDIKEIIIEQIFSRRQVILLLVIERFLLNRLKSLIIFRSHYSKMAENYTG
jgi:hypothetical protein